MIQKRFLIPILKFQATILLISILNPEEMIQRDPIAIKLLAEANGAPMANQNLTEEEARALLEYFRTKN